MKTSMISRTWRGTIAIAMALTAASSIMGAVPTIAASKTGDNVDITINKKDGLHLNGPHQNTGVAMPDLDNQEPVAEVGFTVYDVSQYFYDNYDGENAGDLYKDLTNNWDKLYAANATSISEAKTQQETDKEGKTTFTGLPTKVDYKINAEGDTRVRNAVYVIVETKLAGDMTPSLPMVVAMPVYMPKENEKDPDVVNKNIQLYPKNYGVDKVLLEGNEPVDESKSYDFEVGKVLTYQVKFAIPEDIGHTKVKDGTSLYDSFLVYDAMSKVGATFKGITSMEIAGENVLNTLGEGAPGVTFKSTLDEADKAASWSLDYNIKDAAMREVLANYAGKTMTVKYQVMINENAKPDEMINNIFKVDFDRDGTDIKQKDDGPNVTTGGAQFIKVNSTDLKKPLEGAVFKVKNAAGKYAKFIGAGGWKAPSSIEWKDTEAEGTEITTEKDGKIVLQGLEYNEGDEQYVLVEITPPTGFVSPVNPNTPFTVTEGSYSIDKLLYVKNTPETDGKLPLTGGIGLITLVVVGGALMGASALKKKED